LLIDPVVSLSGVQAPNPQARSRTRPAKRHMWANAGGAWVGAVVVGKVELRAAVMAASVDSRLSGISSSMIKQDLPGCYGAT
jgi:hypothetical protein